MFTTEHWIWIGICIVFITALTYLSLRLRFSLRTASFIMAGISLVSEGSKILSHMEFVSNKDPMKGMVIDAEALPLHLCSLFIFAFFYLPFCENEKLKKRILSLTVPVGLMGATLAILLATSGTDFTAAEPYQCFLYHAGMLWFALYLVITRQADLGRRAWLRNCILLFSMAIFMVWVNGFLQTYNTNFWYVVRPPVKNLPILNLENGWYAYFATLISIGFAALTAVHLPFMLKESREKKKCPAKTSTKVS